MRAYIVLMINMITKIEMECNTCGDHEMCDPKIINICRGCDSGVMVKYQKE